MKLIETKTLLSNAAAIEFTSIPADFTDLVIILSLRSNRSGQPNDNASLRFNGVGTNLFTRRFFTNFSDSPTTDTSTSALIGNANAATSTANAFGNFTVYVSNYLESVNKSFYSDHAFENNSPSAVHGLTSHRWSDTSPITSFSVISETASNFVTGSSISLYGILKGSDGRVTTS